MGLEGRLRRLEAANEETTPVYWSREEWCVQEQLEEVAYMLSFYMKFHADGGVRYSATDREMALFELLCEAWKLDESTQRLFERMHPDQQPDRERWLFEDRHRAKKDRERVAWHQEHGWEKPTPDHLRTW